jgi:chemotaxis methyl-accepting protein methylase
MRQPDAMSVAPAFFSSSLGRPLGRLLHARALRRQQRTQTLTTSLFRNVQQISAFEGPLRDIPAGGRMRVLVAGCSLGCEAYTLAGYLAARFPQLNIAIDAFDIDPGAIEHARTGLYSAEYVNESIFQGPFADVATALIVKDDAGWRIRSDVAGRVSFSVGDALKERPDDSGRYDAVFAQNFLVHMDDANATKALTAMAACLRPGGAMFLGGMTLDMRAGATRQAGLAPVDWNIREIHDEDTVRRNAWPFAYWSLEPLDDGLPDWKTRYGTIFLKS